MQSWPILNTPLSCAFLFNMVTFLVIDATDPPIHSNGYPGGTYESSLARSGLFNRNKAIYQHERERFWISIIKQLEIPITGQLLIICDGEHSDIEMAISHAAVKVSLVRLGASLTKTEALETLDRIPPVPDRYILLACGMGCVTRLLEQANAYDSVRDQHGYMKYFHRWLIVLLRNNSSYLQTVSKHIGHLLHVTIVTEQGLVNRSTYSWSPGGGLSRTVEFFPYAAYGLNGKSLRVGINTWPGYIEERKAVDGQIYYIGYCIEILKLMASRMNFTYSLSMAKDGQWGSQEDDGSWNGLVGELQRKEIDLTPAPLTASVIRKDAMSFSDLPTYVEYYTVLVRPSASLGADLHIKPFKMDVWLCVVASVILTGVVLTVTSLVHSCNFRTLSQICEVPRRWIEVGLNEIWLACSVFLHQSSRRTPACGSHRLVVAFFWLYVIIIGATYSGNLVAFLATEKASFPFNSLQEMVEQNKYTFGTLGSTLFIDMLKQANSPTEQEMWKKIKHFNTSDPSVLGLDNNRHIQKVKEDNYAYIVDYTTVSLARSQDCNFAAIQDRFPFMFPFSLGFPRNSALKEPSNEIILMASESGISQRWKRTFWPRTNHCPDPRGVRTASPTAVQLQHLYGLMLVIGVLLTLSSTALLTENLISRMNRNASTEESNRSPTVYRTAFSQWRYPAQGSSHVGVHSSAR